MTRQWRWRLAAVLLVLGVGWAGVRGETVEPGSQRVVRVAFCPERGMCELSDRSTREGVVPAWMWRLAAVRKWKVEWVELSWREALNQVAEGKVDLVGGAVKSMTNRNEMVFSAMPIVPRRGAVYVLSSSPFQASDLKSLRGCRIGVVEGGPPLDRVSAFLESRGASGVTFVGYGDACQLERALFAGEVGAVLCDITVNLAEERELLWVGSENSYFATSPKNRELMAEIDQAMREILEEEPGLASALRSRHFPGSRQHELMLTSAERAWIARRTQKGRAVMVDISPEDPPFKVYDASSGRVSGNFGELLEEVSDMTGLAFEFMAPTSAEEGEKRFQEGKSDIWIPFSQAEPPAMLRQYKPVMVSIPDACCTRRYGGREFGDSNSRISVWSGSHERLAAYARQGYLSRLIVCDSREDCLRVVADGRADMTFLPYGAGRRMIAQMELQDRMDIRIVDPHRFESKIALYLSPRADPEFVSIVRKALLSISRDRMVDIIHRAEANDNNASPRLTREQKVLWCGVPILVGLLLLLLVAVISRRRVKAALHRSEMSLRVADDALKDSTKAHQRMREALDRAEFAARSKANFLATMSHEIRTPLNAVIGFSEFLGEPNLPLDKIREYANGISFSANSLLSLLNDILDISKFESGRTEGLDMRTGSSDVRALFREMESVFKMKGAEKNIDVLFECDGEVPRLKLFEPRLRQILFNLVGNAVKFTDRGVVVAMASYREKLFRLEVRDTGIGISPRGLKLVFDPFSQDMESRSGKVYAGTGLGLSIVKRLVEASGGKITVSSEIGKGSSFVVELPDIEALSTPEAKPASADGGEDFTVKFRQVVIVDDTKMNCRLLMALCRKLGLAEVRCFFSGAEVLEYFEGGGSADIVLSDLWMPGMNGSELARRLSELKPGLPVVAVTADTDASATFDIKFFRSIIAKPVTLQKLQELLVRLASGN